MDELLDGTSGGHHAQEPAVSAVADPDVPWVLNPSMRPCLRVELRTREHGMQTLELDVAARPELRRIAVALLRGEADALCSPDAAPLLVQALQAKGLLVPADAVPQEVVYMPRRVSDGWGEGNDPGVPTSPTAEGDEGFVALLGAHIGMVTQPLGNRLPVSLGEIPTHMPSPPGRGREAPMCAHQALGRTLAADRYVVLRGLISASELDPFTSYVRALRTEGYLQRGDEQVAQRWVRHNDPVMRALHTSLVPLISGITSVAFGPCVNSYSYLATYLQGASLPRHVDRPQCRWNMSLVLGHRGGERSDAPWPIFVETPEGAQEICLQPGDGLLYSGSELPHWREPLTHASEVSACFFHFVDEGFEGDLH